MGMMMVIRVCALVLALVVAVGSAGAQTADSAVGWPERPIKLVVPFPAGSSTDVIGRILAQSLAARLGQPVVIENRAGGSGMLGSEAVAHAKPDGYTLGVATTSTHALAPSLSAKLAYDPLGDFAPVSMIGDSPYVMVTAPQLGTKSVQDFVALAKSKPGKLTFGSAGPGSLAHLAGVLFAHMAGIEIIHVPYKSSGQSATDLMSGRLDMQFATIPPTLPLIQNGQLQALATTGEKRPSALAGLPTISETGYSGYDAVLWMALVAPAASPQPIIAKLNGAVRQSLENAEIKAALVIQGFEAAPGTPEALRARIAADIKKWRTVVAKAGIQPE
jgi:tripartite-type tricarboxylate transporter receptor subunit TctC